jgi:hypothetical protein
LHLRALTLAFALLAPLAALGSAPEHAAAGPRAAQVIHGPHQQPLPFLASGGVLVQVPITQPSPGLLPLRPAGTSVSGTRPALKVVATRQTPNPLRHDGGAWVRACLLGTPPPAPRSQRA